MRKLHKKWANDESASLQLEVNWYVWGTVKVLNGGSNVLQVEGMILVRRVGACHKKTC